MKMANEVKGFEKPSNGQEAGDKEVVVKVDKDKAMRLGLTVAQVYSELADKLKTEKDSTTLTVGSDSYNVKIVDDREELNTSNIMDYEFETTTTDANGKTKTKKRKLKEFASFTISSQGVTYLLLFHKIFPSSVISYTTNLYSFTPTFKAKSTITFRSILFCVPTRTLDKHLRTEVS